jgi:hypothetical protein
MKLSSIFPRANILFLFTLFCFAASLQAQTTGFTYQGRLSDSAATGGSYNIRFRLFDAETGGSQIPDANTEVTTLVTVSNGVFTVKLDFGAAAFDTAQPRYLEISVKKPADADYTTLSPRQEITSAPFAIRAKNAGSADSLSASCAGCVTNVNINSVAGSKVTGSVANADNAANAANAASATTAASAQSIAATAGNSVIGSINNTATNTIINSNRLSGDIPRLSPTTMQIVPSNNTNNAVLHFGSVSNGEVFRLNDDGSFFSRGDDFVGPIPIEGTGTRLMWYAGKGSFRVGRVNGTNWNDSNVGMYSIAMGYNSKANGDNTFAVGPGATASQGSAVAIGQDVTSNSYASVTLGYKAHSNQKPGSFVFGDFSTPDEIRSGANNQATFRVAGGFRIYSNANLLSGVILPANGSAWEVVSDRNSKENIVPVKPREVLRGVLSLPISTWNYKVQNASIKHIGPMAQDFKAAFNLGEDDKRISTIDPDGVALAAIQGLNEEMNERIEDLKNENSRLQNQISEQNKQLAAFEARLKQLEKASIKFRPTNKRKKGK